MIDRVKKLRVYSDALTLVREVYALLKMFPQEEQYALCDQLRRAVISVPSNIAEGMERSSDKDQGHFLEIAYGSLLECQCPLEIACELGYIVKEQYEQLDGEFDKFGIMITNLCACRRKPIIVNNRQ